MLKNLRQEPDFSGAAVRVRDAQFPAPFESGLEYNAPARGPWNIVHTGMLIPESNQIFVCAQGCLRGVVLTAAEMNAMDRLSWVSVCEHDVLEGDMTGQMVDGIADVLEKKRALGVMPRAVLVFLSCIHLFAGCDFQLALAMLRERFPETDFVDCYMNPTMRKSGLTPDQIMRRQLYALLKPAPLEEKSVNIIGNDRPTAEGSELLAILRSAGFLVRDITRCETYGEYQAMARSALNITYLPAAEEAGKVLSQRLGQRHLHLSQSYGFDEIEAQCAALADAVGAPRPDLTKARDRAEKALEAAWETVRETPVEIDYTAVPRPLGLARLLLEHGFRVRTVYADGFVPEEEPDFRWLRENAPELELMATVNVKMRFKKPEEQGKVLAVGQKAAYFANTPHFVNIVAGGGLWGFDGVEKLSRLLAEAFSEEKDTETVIQYKGLGCESCL